MEHIAERHGGDGYWSSLDFDCSWSWLEQRQGSSRICFRDFLIVVGNQSSWACFFSESVAFAHTLGHTSVLRRTRLLFHHQCHFKSNQTRRQDPLEYNALCVPAQDAHLFTVGLSRTTPSRFKLVRPRSTHSRRSGIHDAVHFESRRRFHQELLGVNTLVSPPFATRQCGSRPLLHHARLSRRDSDKATTRRPWDHKFSLPDSQPLRAFPSSPSLVRNVRQLLRRQCRPTLGRGHSNHRRLDFSKCVFPNLVCATC